MIAVSIVRYRYRRTERNCAHRIRLPSRIRCYSVIKEQKETFIFVNGHNYPVKNDVIVNPNTKIKVSNFIRIYLTDIAVTGMYRTSLYRLEMHYNT